MTPGRDAGLACDLMPLSPGGVFWQAGGRKFSGSMMRSRAGQGNGMRGKGPARRLHFLWLLAVIPFLLLSLMMPGTMLARDAQGGVTVVLCADGAAVEMVMGADGRLTEKSPNKGHSICHWAPHAQQLLDVSGPALAAPTPVPMALRFAADLPERLRRADVLAPLARGPPVFV